MGAAAARLVGCIPPPSAAPSNEETAGPSGSAPEAHGTSHAPCAPRRAHRRSRATADLLRALELLPTEVEVAESRVDGGPHEQRVRLDLPTDTARRDCVFPGAHERLELACTTGTPKTAITASPTNFSTVPPCRSSTPCTTSKYRHITRRRSSASSRSPSAVESATSVKKTPSLTSRARGRRHPAEASLGGPEHPQTSARDMTKISGVCSRNDSPYRYPRRKHGTETGSSSGLCGGPCPRGLGIGDAARLVGEHAVRRRDRRVPGRRDALQRSQPPTWPRDRERTGSPTGATYRTPDIRRSTRSTRPTSRSSRRRGTSISTARARPRSTRPRGRPSSTTA